MELILIRHGKAEERQEMTDDSLRKLTAEGKKRLHKTLPSLGLLIKNIEKAQIWTSPLVRARQTAEISAKILGVSDIIEHEFVSSGEFADLATALADQRNTATVILVGHEPWLSEWTRQLCGASLSFKKGAAACILVNPADLAGSELLWFFQPQPLGRLGETLLKNSLHRG